MRSSASVVMALLLALLAALAEAAPPRIPFGGNNIDGNLSFARRFYPDVLKKYFDRKVSGVLLHTPTLDRMASGKGGLVSDVQGGRARFTTNEEMMDFIGGLPTRLMRSRSLATIESKSKTGKVEAVFALPIMIFSKPPVYDLAGLRELHKPVVWFQAQIHGDEGSGADAMLALARDLAADKEGLLDEISVVIVPRVNVDGAWRNRRGTDSANPDFENLDLNRDALAVLSPITRAVRSAFIACRPDVFVDFHEMGYELDGSREYLRQASAAKLFVGYRYYGDHDLATLVAHPYNVPKRITELARELEAGVARTAASAGLKVSRYAYDADSIVGTEGVVHRFSDRPGDYCTVRPARMMEGPPDECIADSAAALSPSVSLLVEARSPKILVNFKTRVYAHYVAGRSILRQVASCPDVFREAVEKGRMENVHMGERSSYANEVVLWVKQSEEQGADVSVLALDAPKRRISMETLKLDVLYTNRTLTPVKSVKRPYAYVLSADAANAPRLAERLSLTGVKLNRLGERTPIRVEAYRVESVAASGDPRLGFGTRSGDYFPMNRTLAYAIDEVNVSVKKITFPKGTYFFYMAQPSANLAALAVEPMANRNLGNYWYTLKQAGKKEVPGFLPFEVGGEFPIYRCMEAEDFSVAALVD